MLRRARLLAQPRCYYCSAVAGAAGLDITAGGSSAETGSRVCSKFQLCSCGRSARSGAALRHASARALFLKSHCLEAFVAAVAGLQEL